MEKRRISDTENRLLLLYALEALGPVTAFELLDFLSALDLMNYFEMQLNLSALQQLGQVSERPHPLGSLYQVTEEGRYALLSFHGRLPHSRTSAIDRAAAGARERFRGEQQAIAEKQKLSDGRVCLRARLLERNTALLDLLLLLPPQTQTGDPSLLWPAEAPAVYARLIEHLAAPAAQADPAAEALSTLERTDDGQVLFLTDDPQRPQLTLVLTFADEALARQCAAAWPGQRAAIRTLLLDAFRAVLPPDGGDGGNDG